MVSSVQDPLLADSCLTGRFWIPCSSRPTARWRPELSRFYRNFVVRTAQQPCQLVIHSVRGNDLADKTGEGNNTYCVLRRYRNGVAVQPTYLWKSDLIKGTVSPQWSFTRRRPRPFQMSMNETLGLFFYHESSSNSNSTEDMFLGKVDLTASAVFFLQHLARASSVLLLFPLNSDEDPTNWAAYDEFENLHDVRGVVAVRASVAGQIQLVEPNFWTSCAYSVFGDATAPPATTAALRLASVNRALPTLSCAETVIDGGVVRAPVIIRNSPMPCVPVKVSPPCSSQELHRKAEVNLLRALTKGDTSDLIDAVAESSPQQIANVLPLLVLLLCGGSGSLSLPTEVSTPFIRVLHKQLVANSALAQAVAILATNGYCPTNEALSSLRVHQADEYFRSSPSQSPASSNHHQQTAYSCSPSSSFPELHRSKSPEVFVAQQTFSYPRSSSNSNSSSGSGSSNSYSSWVLSAFPAPSASASTSSSSSAASSSTSRMPTKLASSPLRLPSPSLLSSCGRPLPPTTPPPSPSSASLLSKDDGLQLIDTQKPKQPTSDAVGQKQRSATSPASSSSSAASSSLPPPALSSPSPPSLLPSPLLAASSSVSAPSSASFTSSSLASASVSQSLTSSSTTTSTSVSSQDFNTATSSTTSTSVEHKTTSNSRKLPVTKRRKTRPKKKSPQKSDTQEADKPAVSASGTTSLTVSSTTAITTTQGIATATSSPSTTLSTTIASITSPGLQLIDSAVTPPTEPLLLTTSTSSSTTTATPPKKSFLSSISRLSSLPILSSLPLLSSASKTAHSSSTVSTTENTLTEMTTSSFSSSSASSSFMEPSPMSSGASASAFLLFSYFLSTATTTSTSPVTLSREPSTPDNIVSPTHSSETLDSPSGAAASSVPSQETDSVEADSANVSTPPSSPALTSRSPSPEIRSPFSPPLPRSPSSKPSSNTNLSLLDAPAVSSTSAASSTSAFSSTPVSSSNSDVRKPSLLITPNPVTTLSPQISSSIPDNVSNAPRLSTGSSNDSFSSTSDLSALSISVDPVKNNLSSSSLTTTTTATTSNLSFLPPSSTTPASATFSSTHGAHHDLGNIRSMSPSPACSLNNSSNNTIATPVATLDTPGPGTSNFATLTPSALPSLVSSTSQDGINKNKVFTPSWSERARMDKLNDTAITKRDADADARKDIPRSQVVFLPSLQLGQSSEAASAVFDQKGRIINSNTNNNNNNNNNNTADGSSTSLSMLDNMHLRPSHRDFALPTPDITDLFNLLRAHPRAHQEGLSFTVSKRFCVFHPFNTSQNIAVTEVVVERVIASAATPLLLSLKFKNDSDRVLFKCGDDLRLDMAVMQTFRVMNELWAQNELQFEGVAVHARTYGIVALTPSMGLVEFVEGCGQLKNIADGSFTPAALTNMVASAAGAYVAAYVLKIRDRHFDNILVHRDGWLFHIDFSHILGASLSLDTSEFAVTSELHGVLGPTRYPAFVETCVQAFSILRRNFEVLKRLAVALFLPFEGFHLKLDAVLRDSLMMRLSEAEAIESLKVTIENAPFNLKTKIKNVIHELATTLDSGL